MKRQEYIVVMATVPTEELGAKIAYALIEQKLVPCANIIKNVRSIYTWKSKINDEPELIMIMKTRVALFDQVRDAIKAIHTYECPEIIAIPIVAGYPPYLQWIDDNTQHR
nr:divalent-cation tolerance protein CutA [Candidatus Sigynarchaeota archaeon]